MEVLSYISACVTGLVAVVIIMCTEASCRYTASAGDLFPVVVCVAAPGVSVRVSAYHVVTFVADTVLVGVNVRSCVLCGYVMTAACRVEVVIFIT